MQIVAELGVSRRNLICGLVVAGVSGPLVAACGGSDAATGTPTGTGTTPAGGATASAGGSTGAAAGAIKTSEIPVGGGKIFASEGYIVTQPTAGEFKAFSAACTHQGTQLNSIADGTMTCPNHGSQFSLEGAVEQGPATQPLLEKTVTVTGNTLTVT